MEKITTFDFPDTLPVADGWESKEIIDLTRDNMAFLTKKLNELIGIVNELRGE